MCACKDLCRVPISGAHTGAPLQAFRKHGGIVGAAISRPQTCTRQKIAGAHTGAPLQTDPENRPQNRCAPTGFPPADGSGNEPETNWKRSGRFYLELSSYKGQLSCFSVIFSKLHVRCREFVSTGFSFRRHRTAGAHLPGAPYTPSAGKRDSIFRSQPSGEYWNRSR